jgi:hypothetical protein
MVNIAAIAMSKQKAILVAVAIFGIIFLIKLVAPILGQRVVARAVAPDGTEMCVIQTFTWSPDVFNTKFVFHKPGTNWQAYYFEHEDWDFWRGGKVVLDTTNHIAVFYRTNSPAITFDWVSFAYTLHRQNDTRTSPTWVMPPDWKP